MRPAPPCYYIEPSEDDEDDVRLAFAWLHDAMLRSPEQPPRGLVLTSVKVVITNTVPAKALGQLAYSLASGQEVRFGGGTIINLTERQMSSWRWKGPVLALYPDMDRLGKVDDMWGVTEVLALPWHADISGWVTRRNAVELRGNAAPEPARLHPILMAALDSIAPWCGHGGLGLDDRDGVTEIFLSLRQAGIPFTGDDARNYVMGKHGWSSIAADYVAKRGDDINAGKQIRWPKHRRFQPEVVAYWRDKAAAPVS